jgi:hypothetical protein
MAFKPVHLALALVLTGASLLPGMVSAHGQRGWDHDRYWDQRGHLGCDRCDRGGHRHHKHRHGRGYTAPRVIYRDRWGDSRGSRSGVTVIYSGRWR